MTLKRWRKVGDNSRANRWIQRLLMLETWVLLLCAAALILLAPLRNTLEAYDPVLFASTFVLFIAPGVLLWRWFFREHLPGAVLVPVSFAISTGLFGLLGVPMLILHLSLDTYLVIAGIVLAAFLLVAGFRILRGVSEGTREVTPAADFSVDWLWAPFIFLSAALAFVSRARVPSVYQDVWVYLAYVREFLSTDKLAVYEPYFGKDIGLSRSRINGWLLEQTAFSRISGIDPVEMALKHLGPVLVVVALLAFYALARILFESQRAALVAGCLYALFLLLNLDASVRSFGGEFIGRATEDKIFARFLFLPVMLTIAVVFLRSGKLRYMWTFAFLCWAVMAVHPIGLAIAGLSLAGFGLIYLALNWRSRESWLGIAGLGLAGVSAIVVPAVIVYLITGESFITMLQDADINSNDPDVLANMVFVKPYWHRVYELGNGLYTMHPSFLLEPAILAAFFLGIPFLLNRLRRGMAAQLLLGMMCFSTIVCYVPWISTFVGNHIVLPGQLWRLTWPTSLAALLVLGWMGWEAVHRAELGLEKIGVSPKISHLLPLVIVVALILVAKPAAMAGAKQVYGTNEVAQDKSFCLDPVFPWMRDNITRPSVVLAPDSANTCIPAYSSQANVLSLRGSQVLNVLPALEKRAPGQIQVPQGARDVRKFFSGTTLKEGVKIIRSNKVDYVMVFAGSPLDESLKHLSGFASVHTPGERYSLYSVDYRKLGK